LNGLLQRRSLSGSIRDALLSNWFANVVRAQKPFSVLARPASRRHEAASARSWSAASSREIAGLT
jgi:hypothetical protein